MADFELPRRRPLDARALGDEPASTNRSSWLRPPAPPPPRAYTLASPAASLAPPEQAGPAVEQRTLAQLQRLRNQVSGINGSMVATSDGLLVTYDMLDLEPSHAAAVIATMLSVVREAARLMGRGQLREAVVHGSTGYVAVFAVGAEAVLAVLGDRDLNVGMLHYQTREAVRHLERDADQFRRFAISLPAQ